MIMPRRNRALWYAVAGAMFSLGEPIGLLVVREWYELRPISTELMLERVTYVYLFITAAALLACVGYVVGRQADQLAALSETDALTNLANRRALRRRLTEEIRRAARYLEPVSLVLVDVDGLKRINDEHGHAAGDHGIRRVADAIAATLRASDLGARWGGDEFAIVLPNSGTDAARHFAERVIARLSQADKNGAELVTISAGVATLGPARPDIQTMEELAAAADEALYAAKAAGKNRVHAA